MKRKRTKLIRIALILLVAWLSYRAVIDYVLPIQKTQKYSERLSEALTNPSRVTLVEFEQASLTPDELVFKQVEATDAQISALRSVADVWFAPMPDYMMFCFEPHHRVEIVRKDGAIERFEVCFHCQNFRFEQSDIQTLPDVWRTKLTKFFTDAGMPPLEDYSEKAKAHPDYEHFERKQREREGR